MSIVADTLSTRGRILKFYSVAQWILTSSSNCVIIERRLGVVQINNGVVTRISYNTEENIIVILRKQREHSLTVFKVWLPFLQLYHCRAPSLKIEPTFSFHMYECFC